ncbi:FG-GAP-like repeat-containing protein [Lysobacter sp. Hz 25]|uniref:FG-GAP-like repeat-containing protein n=1 Tax=Lysobacter sp. Hz 25 TaxID=3383698 RepID=UPI0038D3AD64
MRSATSPFADPVSARLATRRIAAAGFARLPDRGDLTAYPTKQPVVSDGAYTWHRVELSEQHALAAIIGGHLRITTPSGEKLDFRYERHVEHPSGDWTWVGRIDRGGLAQEAIITFGERAVFGSIAQPGKPALKLTLRDGKSWLVETDPAKLALIENSIGPDHADDYLIPTAAANASSLAPTSASIGAAATAADGQVLVDVLVGYSDGFANGLGGPSQAVTRLNYLVEVTNQAYVNSQITSRIRMVHAMQVNYPDDSDNGGVLEKMTGTRTTPVDPAFNALRAAREQYGADLVSFVRKYDRAAQDGCGIAWLLGGNQQPISASSATNGYSVVGDGRQNDGGTTYFCRDETFAHELGHNMGAQHDRDTASSSGTLQYGAYAYSFGYRAGAVTGNFYDIMAYGDPGQTSYRVFSNPRISTCGGYACGVVGQADTAQTLNQTQPIIATFRATVVPPVPIAPQFPELIDARAQDVNGDGRSDLLWRLDAKTDWAYWTMNGGSKTGGAGYSVGPTWSVVATGDFRGDGRMDLIWTDGIQMQMWEGNGTAFAGGVMRTYPAGYRVIAVGDVNGDGRTDLVWRDEANSLISIWLMNGPEISGSSVHATSPAWRVLGSGDLSGDGRLDLIWTDGTSMQLWAGRVGGGYAGLDMGGYPTGWALFGVVDIDGDGKDDVLWRHQPTGQVAYWRMDGGTRLSGAGFNASTAWRPIQVGDWNGDGRGDIVWSDGQSMQIWAWNGTTFAGQALPGYPVGWSLIRR